MGISLDQPACGCCGEIGPLYLRGRCHPEGAVNAGLDAAEHQLTIECRSCGRPVATFQLVRADARPLVAIQADRFRLIRRYDILDQQGIVRRWRRHARPCGRARESSVARRSVNRST